MNVSGSEPARGRVKRKFSSSSFIIVSRSRYSVCVKKQRDPFSSNIFACSQVTERGALPSGCSPCAGP